MCECQKSYEILITEFSYVSITENPGVSSDKSLFTSLIYDIIIVVYCERGVKVERFDTY